MTPTHEQSAILDATSSTSANLMIEALAGTGKTSTLEMLARVLPRTAPVLYLCFNKKIADEATTRMPPAVVVRTFNSLGHRIWAETISKRLSLETRKVGNILAALIDEAPKREQSVLWGVFSEVVQGVGFAKALGYLPEGLYPSITSLVTQGTFHSLLEEEPDDLVTDLIDAVLTRSIKQSFEGLIDYNDQLYMPALFRSTYPRYSTILVDEYQDLSPVNHAMLSRLVRGRLIGVGDPNQNIYAFRGAKAGGIREAISSFSMTTLPLSISFRCPSAIVSHVRWHVPTFRASKEGGNVSSPHRIDPSDIADGSTIICRNNAPILRVALQLLSAGRSISVAGSDIGPRIIGVMKKLGDPELGRSAVLTAIDAWLAEKLAKESKTAEDIAGCMRVFAEQGTSLAQAISYAEHVFKQQGQILLTTIHKAKGLEWPNVFHLDPWLVRKHPSRQNRNLDYVCSTRSCESLTEIDSGGITW